MKRSQKIADDEHGPHLPGAAFLVDMDQSRLSLGESSPPNAAFAEQKATVLIPTLGVGTQRLPLRSHPLASSAGVTRPEGASESSPGQTTRAPASVDAALRCASASTAHAPAPIGGRAADQGGSRIVVFVEPRAARSFAKLMNVCPELGNVPAFQA